MKAVCISGCEIDKIGIVTPGEEVELPDAYANDVRINQHFVIDRGTITNPDAKLPDYEADDEARREEFEKSLMNESKWLDALNRLVDAGVEVPADVLEGGRLTEPERIKKLVDLWIDDFGYVFPTDPKEDREDDDDPKDKKSRNKNGQKRSKGTSPEKAAEEAQPGEGEGDDGGNKDSHEDDLFGGKK